MKHLAAVATLIMLLAPAVSAAPIRLPLGRNYFALYDAQTKTLQCVSENEGRKWRAGVATSVPSQSDWAGRATAAGPVFVYTSNQAVQFVLLRFQDGSATADKSGESLRGRVASGQLMGVSWIEGDYGAKADVVTLAGNIEYTTRVDINMWGTGKVLSQTHRTVQPTREKVPNTGLSFELPLGFSSTWDAGSSCLGLKSDKKLPMGILISVAEGGLDLPLFADEFMKMIGPAMGADNLKVALSSQVNVGPLPGLLRLTKCTWNAKPATFAFVFCGNAQNTYVFVYGSRDADYDQYAGIFYRLLGSVRFQ